MNKPDAERIDFGDRLVGAIVAVLFAVPTVAICWLVLNYELATVSHFLASGYFYIVAGAAVVLGFAFPRLLFDLLGALWRAMYRLAKWW